MAFPVAYAVIAGLQMIGDFLTTMWSEKKNDERIRESRDWEERMQDKENEYNEPVNKIQREQEAGILRNSLATASGSLYSTNSAGHNAVSPIPYSDPIGNLANLYSSFFSGMNQGEQAKTENDLRGVRKQNLIDMSNQYVANTQVLGLNARSLEIANSYADALNELAVSQGKLDLGLTYWQTKQVKQGIKNMVADLESTYQGITESKARTGLILLDQQQVLSELETMVLEREQIRANTSLLENESALTGEKLTTEALTQSNIAASTSGIMSNTQLTDEQLNLVRGQFDLFMQTYDDQVTKIAADAKISKREAWLCVVRALFGSVKDTAVGIGGVAAGAKMLGSGAAAAPAAGAAAAAASIPPVPF